MFYNLEVFLFANQSTLKIGVGVGKKERFRQSNFGDGKQKLRKELPTSAYFFERGMLHDVLSPFAYNHGTYQHHVSMPYVGVLYIHLYSLKAFQNMQCNPDGASSVRINGEIDPPDMLFPKPTTLHKAFRFVPNQKKNTACGIAQIGTTSNRPMQPTQSH